MKYTDRIIKSDGTSFEMFKETQETQTMTYRTQDIDKSHELWQQANGRVNAFIYHQKQALIKATKGTPEVIDVETNNLSDIDTFYMENGKKGLLEFEFESCSPDPEEYTNEKGETLQKWKWKHRLTGRQFYRHQSRNGKSFDTGRLSKFLMDMKQHDNPLAYARAKHVIQLNKSTKQAITDDIVVPLDRKQVLRQQVCVFFLCILCF
jgi:hypothetical protein